MRRVFYEQPSLWRGFIMLLPDAPTSELLNAKLALLRRVAPLVSWFAVMARKSGSSWRLDGSGGHPPLDAFLQLLPSSLDILFLDTLELPASTTQLLQRFTALHRLRTYELVEAEGLTAALQQMSQLVHLDCSMRTYPDLQQLTQLSRLQDLHLRVCSNAFGSLRAPTLAALPQLGKFALEAVGAGTIEVRAESVLWAGMVHGLPCQL